MSMYEEGNYLLFHSLLKLVLRNYRLKKQNSETLNKKSKLLIFVDRDLRIKSPKTRFLPNFY